MRKRIKLLATVFAMILALTVFAGPALAIYLPVQPKPADRFTVSYHPNNAFGEAPMDMNRYYRGEEVTLMGGEGLTKPGYVFAGWELLDGTPVSEPFIITDQDVTLFATWVKK